MKCVWSEHRQFSNNTSSPQHVEGMQTAAKALGQALLVLRAGTGRELDEAFAVMAQQKVSAVLYGQRRFFRSSAPA